jgi:ABC-type multidrug transport system fused ATPase/permease subunit
MKGTAMETINQIMNFADAMLEHLPQQITPINSTVLAAIIIVLSVLFTAPSRLAEILVTIALAMLGLLILSAPNYAMVLFVLGCGLVGIVRSRRKSDLLQKQLDKLSRVVQELELAENRRLIQSLNSPSPSMARMRQQDTPSIMPNEKIDDAAHSLEPHIVKSLHRT